MISSVRGPVLSIGLDHAVIEVGGVGFAVLATPTTLAGLRRGDEAQLFTALIVREDSLTLFGFTDPDARQLFGLLLTVSGIGPKIALATLAVLEPDKLRAALSEGNTAMLTQVPGIGTKGAQRLIVELRDKVGALTSGTPGPEVSADAELVRAQVTEALLGLGFAAKAAEQAVDAVLAKDGARDTAAVLRQALTSLGRKR
ncbi:Holliday junction branch migration protein RuvA [Kutzneria buriramensis]|uniref:Holliday junction branch migration complex subunit RuvA n=1 Tax=Kutzneria buriramensis TaxID=1045776 RepID=A0A3E0HFP8_9PSEU|nr:Holliday junction branch migration protein RuvA [Kutzneria buriramensis]REH44632.1 Holliday junction DNA helicase RuvA [Kutzneria buriramensis]